jgi:hypothetical protein
VEEATLAPKDKMVQKLSESSLPNKIKKAVKSAVSSSQDKPATPEISTQQTANTTVQAPAAESTTVSQTIGSEESLSSSGPVNLDQVNEIASQELAQMIFSENAAANGGTANLVIDTDAKDVALATTECQWNNANGNMAHNYIPAPGGQNISGGPYQATLTVENAKALAQKFFNCYYTEKTGYDLLLNAGYSPNDIVYGGAKVTSGGITYSAEGMDGTGFETSASGGVISHYAEIANQVPGRQATKFTTSIVYDPQKGFASTTSDFFIGDVNYVYQMGRDGTMGYVAY